MMISKANKRSIALLLLIATCTTACSETQADDSIDWQLVERHAHDEANFTQGLQLKDGTWLESSGGYGRSFVVLEDQQGQQTRRNLPASEFAEGATFSPAGIWLLTWRAGVARLLDDELHTQRTATYDGEGWGLTFDGENLIMSDGTNRLRHRDAQSFELERAVRVQDEGRDVNRLNELEFAHGLLWSNIFGARHIAAINPYTGEVCGWLRLDELANDFERPNQWDAANNVLNGIAVDETNGHLHVTGKRWPRRYEIMITLDAEQRACAEQRPAGGE